VTTAFRENEHIRQVGTERCDWLQPAEKPGAQGRRRRGARRFGLNVAYGLQEGPALSCQGSCELSLASIGRLSSALQLARATVDWIVDNSYFMAELLGRGKGLLAFVMFGASKHNTKINLIGGYTRRRCNASSLDWTGLIVMHDDDIHYTSTSLFGSSRSER
jgi:hypothetical protein